MTSRITSSVGVRRIGQVTVDAFLIALVVAVKLALFAGFGLYSKLWRFVDQADFESIVKAVVVSSFALIGLSFLLAPGDVDPPRGVIALDFLLTLALVGGGGLLLPA